MKRPFMILLLNLSYFGLLTSCNLQLNENLSSDLESTYSVQYLNLKIGDMKDRIRSAFLNQTEEVLSDLGFELGSLRFSPDIVIEQLRLTNADHQGPAPFADETLYYDSEGFLVEGDSRKKTELSWSFQERRYDFKAAIELNSKLGSKTVYFPAATKDLKSKDRLSYYQSILASNGKMVFRPEEPVGDSFAALIKSIDGKVEIGQLTYGLLPGEMLRRGSNYSEYQLHFLKTFKQYCEESKKISDPSFASMDCQKAAIENCQKCSELKPRTVRYKEVVSDLRRAKAVTVKDAKCEGGSCNYQRAKISSKLSTPSNPSTELRRAHQCDVFRIPPPEVSQRIGVHKDKETVLFTYDNRAESIASGEYVKVFQELPGRGCMHKVSQNAKALSRTEAEARYYGLTPALISCTAEVEAKSRQGCGFIALRSHKSTRATRKSSVTCSDANDLWILTSRSRKVDFEQITGRRKCNFLDLLLSPLVSG